MVGLLGGVVAVVPATGGSLTPLTILNGATGDLAHVWPQVLPGGNSLYWTPSSKAEHTAVIYAASIKKPNERVVLVKSETRAVYATDANGNGYLLWQRNGVLLARAFDGATLRFSGEPREVADSVGTLGGAADVWAATSTNGSLIYAAPELQQMTWFERSGKLVGRLGDPGLFFRIVRFSHDGKYVAASRIDVARDSPGSLMWTAGPPPDDVQLAGRPCRAVVPRRPDDSFHRREYNSPLPERCYRGDAGSAPRFVEWG